MTSIHSLVKVNVAVAQVCCANLCCGKNYTKQSLIQNAGKHLNSNKGDTSIFDEIEFKTVFKKQ